jgi:hypothetical protein
LHLVAQAPLAEGIIAVIAQGNKTKGSVAARPGRRLKRESLGIPPRVRCKIEIARQRWIGGYSRL